MSSTVTAIIAHQGGWDEILFVVGPIVAVVGLLRLLKRRVEQNLPPASSADDSSASDVTTR